jgi:hypothetical protein
VLELGGIGLDWLLETCVYFYFYLPAIPNRLRLLHNGWLLGREDLAWEYCTDRCGVALIFINGT